MDNIETTNRKFNAIGWGLLSILWGITILFDFVPFGVGVLGTGLILLGANGVRALNGLPAREDNTVIGLLALSWGILELARPILRPLFELADWDWVIFAILLIELGIFLLAHALVRFRGTSVGNSN